jgi:hypothetical protein
VHLLGFRGGSGALSDTRCHADEADSEPRGGFVLDVEPERSLRREARHLNQPRVGWRVGRNSELARVVGMAVTTLAARSGLRLHDSPLPDSILDNLR